MISLKEFIRFFQVNTALNIISLISGLIVVIIILLLRKYDVSFMKRISIKFTLAIALVDTIRAISFLIYAEIRGEGILCSIVSFTNQSLTLLYLFFTVVIAVNLQLVFIHGHLSHTNYEFIYWITSIFLGIGLPSLPLMLGKLGYDNHTRSCEYVDGFSFNSYLWIWSTFLGWIVLACLYCTGVVILVIFKLRDQTFILHQSLNNYDRRKLKHESLQIMIDDIRKLITRILLYCMIPILTQIGHISLRIYEFYNTKPNLSMSYFSTITTDLAGFLNLIAFLMDPAFIKTFKKISSCPSIHPHHNDQVELEVNCFQIRSDLNSEKTFAIISTQHTNHTIRDSNDSSHSSLQNNSTSLLNSLANNKLSPSSTESPTLWGSPVLTYNPIDPELINCRYQNLLRHAHLTLSEFKSQL